MIRQASLQDREWIRSLSADAYGDLGDYGTIIPSWFDHEGVFSFVDECVTGQPRGFLLLGFFDSESPSAAPESVCIADILAIAVEPDFRRRGIASGLLRHAIQLIERSSQHWGIREIRLTVSRHNKIGQYLYFSNGFHVLDPNHGTYDSGTPAIRMARPIA